MHVKKIRTNNTKVFQRYSVLHTYVYVCIDHANNGMYAGIVPTYMSHVLA